MMPNGLQETLTHTVTATHAVASRARKTFLLTSITYLGAYLYVIGDLRPATGGFAVRLADPGLAFKQISPYYFEGIAVIQSPVATYILSPMNIAIGAVIAGLVGINIAFSYTAFRHPKACGTRNAAGVVSLLPALLGGSACCGPVIIFVLGLQATTTLVSLFSFLVPVAVALLLLTAIHSSRKVDVNALRTTN